MPDFSSIDSWQALAAFALFLLIPHVVTYVQGRRTRKLTAQAAADAAKTREQTENEHQDHPTPNLRQQMDAQDEVIGEIRELLAEHVEQDTAWKASVEDELARRNRPLFAWRR